MIDDTDVYLSQFKGVEQGAEGGAVVSADDYLSQYAPKPGVVDKVKAAGAKLMGAITGHGKKVPPPREFPGFGAQNEAWSEDANPVKGKGDVSPLVVDPSISIAGPGGNMVAAGVKAAEALIVVRDKAMEQARKRYGSRLSDSHYELIGDYAVASGASIGQIFNLASKGDFDTMRAAVGVQRPASSGAVARLGPQTAQELFAGAQGSTQAAIAGAAGQTGALAGVPDPLARYKKDDAAARPAAEKFLHPEPGLGSGVRNPNAPDPWAGFPFTQKDYYEALNQGLTHVRLKGSNQTIGIDVAQRRVEQKLGKDAARQMTKSPGEVEAEFLHGSGGPSLAFGKGNPNAKKGLSEHVVARVLEATGLTEKDIPYHIAGLRFLTGMVDVPAQAGQAMESLKDPGKALAEAARSLDVFGIEGIFNAKAPKIDGPERFTRFLNAAFALAGAKYSVGKVREFIHSNTGLGFAREMGVTAKEAYTILDDLEARQQPAVSGQRPDNLPPNPPEIISTVPKQGETQIGNHRGEKVGSVAKLPVEKIGVRPDLQYKLSEVADAENMVSKKLKGVDVYDVAKGGMWTVWRDLEGNTYALNSHHRRELANRASKFVDSSVKPGELVDSPREVPVRILDEADGWTIEKARAHGALENIAEGNGNAFDAVHILRDSGMDAGNWRGHFGKLGIDINSKLSRNIEGLINLPTEALDYIKNGALKEDVVAGIGAVDGLSKTERMAVLDSVYARAAKGDPPETFSQGEQIARRARGKIMQRVPVEDSGGLFDDDADFTATLANLDVEADIMAGLKRKLAAERSDLIGIPAKLLEGETIRIDERRQMAGELGKSTREAKDRVDFVYDHDKELSANLDKLAREVVNGKLTAKEAIERLYQPTVERASSRLEDYLPEPGQPDQSRIPGGQPGDSGPTGSQSGKLVRRSSWEGFDTDAFVMRERSKGNAQNHPDHDAAKAGDIDAAVREVDAFWDPHVVDDIAAKIEGHDPIVAFVHAEEATGRNAIPMAYAHRLAKELGLDRDETIVQTNVAARTGKSAIYRIATRVEFDGDVEAGREYIIADDFITQGGTLADLKGFIEAKGGKVILATALQSSEGSRGLSPSPKQLAALRRTHPDIDAVWNKESGHGIEGLTKSEASYLLGHPEAVNLIRDRGFAGAQEGGPRKAGRKTKLGEGSHASKDLEYSSLFDDIPEDDFELTPPPAPKPTKMGQAKPVDANPVGKQLSLDETGDKTGQHSLRIEEQRKPSKMGEKPSPKETQQKLDYATQQVEYWRRIMNEAESGSAKEADARAKWNEARDRQEELDRSLGVTYEKGPKLEQTDLPDKRRSDYTPEEFQRRIDEITKIAKAGGANVFRDLKKQGVVGLFESATRRFRRGRVRMTDYISDAQFADTLAHEVGHQIDGIISSGVRTFENLKAARPSGDIDILFDTKGDIVGNVLRDELIKVTEALVGKAEMERDPKYYLKGQELFARFMQSVMFHPHLVEELAPKAFQRLLEQADKFPLLGDYIAVGKGAMLEHPQPFFFLPDARQQRIQRYGRYLGTKIYGEEQIYRSRRAKALQETTDLIKTHFKGVKDKPAILMDAAEGVLTTVDGKPEFGTKIRKEVELPPDMDFDVVQAAIEGAQTTDKKLLKIFDEIQGLTAAGYKLVGLMEDGGAYFEKWRKTPKEAELAYNSLSKEGKQLINDYTADISEAKDIFNRERMKEFFGIEAEIEGYVHHYFEDNVVSGWKRKFLKERKAAATKHRGEVEGYVKDFRKATAKAISELHIVREWNDFVSRQLSLVAEPLPLGEKRPTKDGWVAIEGDLAHGLKGVGEDRTVLLKEDGTSFLLQRGKKYQVPEEIYDTYIKHGAFGKEVSKTVELVNSMNRYWQGNILLHTGTASTNVISGAMQFSAKILNDFYVDLMNKQVSMPRTRTNLMGLAETLTPAGWKAAPDWAFGGDESHFYAQFYGQKGRFKPVDASLDTLLKPYQAIERYFKKAITNAEARKWGTEDPFNDPEFIKHLNDIVDLYAYDYQNIPHWLQTLKQHPAGAGVKPFMTYPYKYAKMLTSMMGGLFDKNLTPQERYAKALTIGTIFTAYGLWKKAMQDPSTVGSVQGYDSETDQDLKLKSVVNPRGRLYMGQDAEGRDKFLRTAKYPFLNIFDTIQAAMEGDMDEVGQIVNDQLGTIGPLGKFTLNQMGYSGEFDKFKTKETQHSETLASFIPLGRMLKDTAEFLDPVKRDLPNSPGDVFGQYIPTTNRKLADWLHGEQATAKVPLKPDELQLIKDRNYTGVVALVEERLGKEAAEEMRKLIDDKLRKQMGIGNSTLELPVPKQDMDVLSKLLGGIIFKRIDREWYERFKMRAQENKLEREKKKLLVEAAKAGG